jgi:transcription antitermination factor NusG
VSTISWYGLKVAPQTELRVQKILHQREFQALAPVEMVRRERARKSGRPLYVKRERPVFPSYVFLQLSHPSAILAERDWINRHVGRPVVFGLLGLTRERPSPLRDEDMACIREVAERLAAKAPLDIIQIGQQIKVRDGHIYEGRTGDVVSLKGRERARVGVTMRVLGSMPVVVEFSASDLVAA